MKYLKRVFLLLLHLAASAAVQLCLLEILLGDGSLVKQYWRYLPLSAAACLVDFFLSIPLLKGHTMRRGPLIAIHFWDLLLASPMFLFAFISMISGGEGTGFGLLALGAEFFLILERSTSFVLFDPARKQADRKKNDSSLARRTRKV